MTSIGSSGCSCRIDGALRQLDQARETIDATVTDILDRYRVEIASVPEISHEELVTRATQRTKPCNIKGDGYRDTLNWLTVLGTRSEEPSTGDSLGIQQQQRLRRRHAFCGSCLTSGWGKPQITARCNVQRPVRIAPAH